MRTLIDNSALAWFHTSLDGARRRDVVDAFTSKRFSFYATNELVEELLRMGLTKSKPLLPERAATLLSLIDNGRILKYYGDIIQDELQAEGKPFLDSGDVANVKRQLGTVADGQFPDDLKDELRQLQEQRRRHYDFRHGYKQRVRGAVTSGDLEAKYADYAEFERFLLPKVCRILQEDLGERDPRPFAKARIVTLHEHLGDFPYTEILLRMTVARLHWNWVQNRKVDPGDECDDAQMAYMQGLDLIISDDRRLGEVFPKVFSGKSLKTPSSFMDDL